MAPQSDRARFLRRILAFGLSLWLGMAPAMANPSETPRELFDAAWNEARENIHPPALSERFGEDQRLKLRARIGTVDDIVDVLGPFLRTLGVSHTNIFDDRFEQYDLLRSMFRYHDPDRPESSVVGIQWGEDGRVRAVLDGLPAAVAGVQVGDQLLHVDGEPFSSRRQWQDREHVRLEFRRDDEIRVLTLSPRRLGVQRAYLEATRNSERIHRCGNRRVGYFRLWAGTHPSFLEALRSAVERFSGTTDALVLDLRDGYGGAWWEYLEPFFADTQDFFVATIESREGSVDTLVPPDKQFQNPYRKPMVVLINGGTRSGKEALAYQFREAGRALLLGQATAGAFSAGRGVFADRDWPILMYLAVSELKLDGKVIEGVGVPPHIEFSGTETAVLEKALGLAVDLSACADANPRRRDCRDGKKRDVTSSTYDAADRPSESCAGNAKTIGEESQSGL